MGKGSAASPPRPAPAPALIELVALPGNARAPPAAVELAGLELAGLELAGLLAQSSPADYYSDHGATGRRGDRSRQEQHNEHSRDYLHRRKGRTRD